MRSLFRDNGLSIVLIVLFIVFCAAHGQAEQTVLAFMSSGQFWFEAMRNWQSEFLAVFSIVVLTIFLRQKGSPESKPLAMPHKENP